MPFNGINYHNNYTFEITVRNEIGVSDPASCSITPYTSEDSKFLFKYSTYVIYKVYIKEMQFLCVFVCRANIISTLIEM